MKWVLNASPVICLSKAGYERLLIDIPEHSLIPEPVAEEIQAGPQDDPARRILETGIFSIVSVSSVPEIQSWDLGKGETAVLSHSFTNPDCVAIIDDSAARKCARTFQIPHKGTLAVVILAKKQGMISSAADVMRSLQVAGIRLDDNVIRTALRETVGEDW